MLTKLKNKRILKTWTVISDPSQNGFPPPKKAKCFQCHTNFYIKYVVPNKSYSKKNNWDYWTNPKAKDPEFWKNKEQRQKDQQICDPCLLKLYYHKPVYWSTIKDLRKRNLLRKYIYDGTITAINHVKKRKN